ncbi:helix-turn-helix domain-containing protein [Bauldia sp.]|uniref:helix-turn-helix domain-containing protein n=1 Tax=Bauldia sp. TaxID=2575872 RepID=UPI003BAA687C
MTAAVAMEPTPAIDPSAAVRRVVELVAAARALPAAALLGAGRRPSHEACQARRTAMYLAAVALELPFHAVGRAFGCDRSTVGVAVRAIEDERDDPSFDAWLNDLELLLGGES